MVDRYQISNSVSDFLTERCRLLRYSDVSKSSIDSPGGLKLSGGQLGNMVDGPTLRSKECKLRIRHSQKFPVTGRPGKFAMVTMK